MPDLMFARLRPDRSIRARPVQHVVAANLRAVPPVVIACCGTRLRAIDLDPGAADRVVGRPCSWCMASVPQVELSNLLRHNDESWPPESLAAPAPPADALLYASGLAALTLRHVVPDNAVRFPHLGRHVLIAECGHMAWCPIVGPAPSTGWPVCAECLDVLRSRAHVEISAVHQDSSAQPISDDRAASRIA